MHSVLSSIQQGNNFDRVIYYKSDPNFPTIDLNGFANVEVKDDEWDCNIEELTSDLQNNRTLLMINSLDNADKFHPPAFPAMPTGVKTASPADSLKKLLGEGPRFGSFVLAFVDDWKRFTGYRDYISHFQMYIGFQLNEEAAGGLVSGGGVGRFKGLDKSNKAIFVNRQKPTMFRPFVVR